MDQIGDLPFWLDVKKHMESLQELFQQHTLQTFVILPKEKTIVWVKQNVNLFQQNGSVIIKIEQN
jgi:hypothetical protein